MIRSTDYKLIRGSDGSRELSHIAEDPDEQHDIADDHPDIVDDLESELDDWLESFDHADASGSASVCLYGNG